MGWSWRPWGSQLCRPNAWPTLPGDRERYRRVVQLGGRSRGNSNHVRNECQTEIRPISLIYLNFRYNNDGRPTGEAEVAFASAQDAKRSLSKDRQNMQHRYVELFYDGPDPDNDNSGGNGGYGGGNGGYGGPGGMMAGGGGGGGGGFGGKSS